MADGIVKAETGIVLPEGVADNVINMSSARGSHKSSFIEAGVYASNILFTMGNMFMAALEGDELAAYFNPPCGESNYCCSSFIGINDKGIIEINAKHNFWREKNEPKGCPLSASFRYNLSINTKKTNN